jgi:putative tryptophan/tyrosine transport system substrate-binding protein
MAIGIGRRQLIGALGSATVAWPLAARAQQPDRMRHIGVFVGLASSADDPVAGETLRIFKEAMQQAGWIEGKNIHLDYRFGGGDPAKMNASATELVALAPELIYAQGLPATRALHQKTRSIPIVFTQVADPVGFGLVESIVHPGGNVTGFIVWDLSIGGKWIQLLREIAPELRRVGVIYNPDTAPYAAPLIASAKAAAGSDMAVIECPTRDDSAIEAAASSLGHEPHGGLLVIPEPFTNAHRDQIIAQSSRFSLPTLNPVSGAANRGALISYTYAFDAMIRQPVTYINRILKGESPNDLPVQAPTKYELVINLKTAKALGLTIQPTLFALADEVIE